MAPSTRNGSRSGRIFCVRFLFASSGERRTYRYASVFLFRLPQEVCGVAGLCHKSGGCFVNGKHFIGNQQLSRKLIGRTKEALRQRNVQFAQAHGDASDEALLDYVLAECDHVSRTALAEEAEAHLQAADFQGGVPLPGGERECTEQQNSSEQSGGRRGSPSSVIGKPL